MSSGKLDEAKKFQGRLKALFIHFLGKERGGQAFLAKKTKLSAAAINEWLKEKNPTTPDQNSLKLISEATGARLAWLAEGEEPMFVPSLEALREAGKRISELKEPGATYVTNALPEHVAEAWAILHEAARAANADLMAMDVPAVGEMLGAAAEAAAAGRGQEARQRAVRRAEVVLKAMGKALP